jgi:hypothetical protein
MPQSVLVVVREAGVALAVNTALGGAGGGIWESLRRTPPTHTEELPSNFLLPLDKLQSGF